MPHVARLAATALLICAGFVAATAAPARAVDWERHAGRDTVTVVTTNPDGSLRDTTVWIAVLDGEAYLRTGGTRWGDNAEREPAVALRVDEEEIRLRAEPVADPDLRARVEAAFRAKYGFQDRLSSLFRFGETRIFRLLPRDAAAAPAGGA
jgi:hypothetical protein